MNAAVGEIGLFVFCQNVVGAPRGLFEQKLNAETAALIIVAFEPQSFLHAFRRHRAQAGVYIEPRDIGYIKPYHARIASSVF